MEISCLNIYIYINHLKRFNESGLGGAILLNKEYNFIDAWVKIDVTN